jgi:hypothetical protein
MPDSQPENNNKEGMVWSLRSGETIFCRLLRKMEGRPNENAHCDMARSTGTMRNGD